MVLKRMLDLGLISPLECEEARGEPLRVSATNTSGDIAPHYVDYVRQQLCDLYDEKTLGSEGLAINTVLHPEMAIAADTVLREELLRQEKELFRTENVVVSTALQGMIVAIQPKTGAILALVGGKKHGATGFNPEYSAYRRAGSAIMPFVYLASLDDLTPVSWLNDEPQAYTINGTNWTPTNLTSRYHGQIMFRDALGESLNAATVNLAARVGPGKITAMIRKLGIQAPLSPYPSVALGDFPVTPLELAGAYAVLDNDGQKPFLVSIKEVITEKGDIRERRHMEFASVTTPAKAYVITRILEDAVQSGGTRNLKDLGVDFPYAAQEGVSSDYRDSWFIAYTTDLLVVVWVGYDGNVPKKAPALHGAGRIWARLLNQVRPWIHPQEFVIPPGIVERMICSQSGELTTPRCREQRLEVFVEEHVPKGYCTLHD
jgi:penicillin-binding protein 1B